MYTDKELVCRDCGEKFIFTAGEQEFYASKGFANEPTRCPECRARRKNERRPDSRSSYSRGPRRMYQAVCARCGAVCEVPFEPVPGKPVYCRTCYNPRSF
ncbi:MAG: zinc-binding protein [Clostridia bacterium]|nr:MAG: zinc-binding protein [Clostridia bacterium]